MPDAHPVSNRRRLLWFLGSTAALLVSGYTGLSRSSPMGTALLSLLAGVAAAARAYPRHGVLGRMAKCLAGLLAVWAMGTMWQTGWLFIIVLWIVISWSDIRALRQLVHVGGNHYQ